MRGQDSLRLADLVDQMELPETQVAEGAWEAHVVVRDDVVPP